MLDDDTPDKSVKVHAASTRIVGGNPTIILGESEPEYDKGLSIEE